MTIENQPSGIELFIEELRTSCTGGKNIPDIIKEVPSLFSTLYRVLKDVDLNADDRLIVYGAIGYFFVPDDVYPEEIHGQIGYIDDVILSLYILNEINNSVLGSEILKRNWDSNINIEQLENHLADLQEKYPSIYIDVLSHIGLIPNEVDF
jgi:uncharacterized membrane protein YkvA (DUF1232 family)